MIARVISNYFGTPPSYFQLWLDSCAMNPQIEWLFFTDIDANKYIVPANVKFVGTTLPVLKDKIQNVFDYKIRYNSAWDFCALRGTFGLAFSDELVGVDYWGWGDCDMVYGDLSQCFVIDGVDKILPKGHLSFVRNNYKLNEFIARHPLTKVAICEEGSGLPCFDEVAIPEVILPEFGAKQDNSIPFVNTACRFGNYVLDDTDALYPLLGINNGESLPFVVTWRDGKMVGHFAMRSGVVCRIELAYFHFFRRDLIMDGMSRLLPNKDYAIVPNKIYEYDGHMFEHDEICRLDRYRIHWAYWRKRMKLKKILQKLGM